MERRYDDDEVTEILARASRGGVERPGGAAEHGLTLRQIQDIGLEVGIAPEEVAVAADELGGTSRFLPSLARVRRDSAIRRVVTVGAAPTQAEWDRVVVGLRETFGGPGSVEQSGDLRSWSGPGVEVHGEPVEDGYRYRIDARDSTAVHAVGVGISSVVVALVMAGALALTGAGDAFTFAASGLVGVVGAVSTAYGRYALARWRKRTTKRLSDAARSLTETASGT